MRLAHLHIPSPIQYSRSLQLQDIVLQRHYAYNSYALQASRSSIAHSSPTILQPPPTLLTFQTYPVYTVGRRHLKNDPLSQTQIDFLTSGGGQSPTEACRDGGKFASFYPAPRGGLLTYHAPGQLTAYLIINLRRHSITPRCFVRLLETSVMKTCARHGVPNTMTTSDPGVWIGERDLKSDRGAEAGQENRSGDLGLTATARKICAVGVHVTRGITTHGIGLNVFDAPTIDPEKLHACAPLQHGRQAPRTSVGYLSWGFERITACGLEGKTVTWLSREGAPMETNLESVAHSLQQEVCLGLSRMGRVDIDGVDILSQESLLAEGQGLSTENID